MLRHSRYMSGGAHQLYVRGGVPVSVAFAAPLSRMRLRAARLPANQRWQRTITAAARATVEKSKGAEAELSGEDPSVFYEPFLRSFVLGLSFGAVFEAIHVSFKFVNLIGEVGFGGLASVLPTVSERFTPLLVDDHVVAACCWLLFYAIEVYAVAKVMDRHAQNPEAAVRAFQTLDLAVIERRALKKVTTLPRLMLPRLSIFKDAARVLGFGNNPVPVAAGSAPNATSFAADPLASNVLAPPKRQSPAPKPDRAPPVSDPRQEPEGPEEEENEAPVADKGSTGSKTLRDRRTRRGLRPGQLEGGVAEFLHRTKELNSRRCYLQNFWYAAGLSENIKDKPVGVEILGEKVVLYRDSRGAVQCLHDVCPHRGAPLHMGWKSQIEGNDCIVCPYHGWAFDGEGKLKDVPAAENSSEWPRKPLVKAYPVEEKGGFVWLFHGSKDLPEGERPPIPYVPELDDPEWRPVYGEIEFECNHWSVFENAIDMAHIHYLHSDSFGNEDQPQIRNMHCATNAFGVDASFSLHNKPVNAMWEFSKVPEVNVTAKALLPSTSVIGFTLGQGLSFITFVNTVPISAKRTINRFALVRRLNVDRIGSFVFNMSAWDSFARKAMLKILSQDKQMVERLMPEMLGREISVKADLPQMAFRKLRQEYIDMGYGVPPEQGSDDSSHLRTDL